MSDYYSLLKRAIEKEPPTGEARRVVYEKARTALVKQLRSVDPPLTEAQITRQRLTLEEAIRRIEAEASEDQVRPATQAPGRSAERPPASRPPPQAERPASRTAAPPRAPQPPAEPAPPARTAPPRRPPEPARTEAPRVEASRDEAQHVETQRIEMQRGEPQRVETPRIEMPRVEARRGEPRRAEPQRVETQRVEMQRGEPQRGEPQRGEAAPATPEAAPAVPTVPARAEPAEEDLRTTEPAPRAETPRRSRRGLVAAVLLLAVAAGAGALLFLNKDAILQALAPQDTRSDGQAGETAPRSAERPKIGDRLPQDGVADAPATPNAAEPQSSQPKSGGRPADVKPAESEPKAGTTPNSFRPTVAPAAQQAVLLEENPPTKPEARHPGRISWRLESEAGPGGPRPVIKGLVEIPERDLKMQLTVKRNPDKGSASLLDVDLLFETPPSFDGGTVSNVAGVLVKDSALARSTPLIAPRVERVTNGYFMIALANGDMERRRNLDLLRSANWFDIPIIYSTGRRAMLSIEKGTPGEQIFRQALDAWGT